MRRNIFDIVNEQYDLRRQIGHLVSKINETDMVSDGPCAYTLFDFVEEYCFEKWKHRGCFFELDDFLNALDYDEIIENQLDDSENWLIVIELFYNMYFLVEKAFAENPLTIDLYDDFHFAKKVMDKILDELNHQAHIDIDEEQVLIVQKDAATTAVAEIINPKLSMPLMRYHHHALKGDIESKKAILIALGADLEEKRKTIAQLNKGLSEMIFQMLNKLNIRHNNISLSGKYEPCVASMSNEELEEWYDELYQMILHAYLLMDHQPRMKKFDELSKKMEDAKKNG